MAPQDDLTAERAAKLYSLLHASISHDYVCGPDDIKAIRKMEIVDKALIMAALQTARQEALREAKEVAKSELRNTMILASCPGQSSAAWNIMWKLDRLASEGA